MLIQIQIQNLGHTDRQPDRQTDTTVYRVASQLKNALPEFANNSSELVTI